jgi:hypothetical protein
MKKLVLALASTFMLSPSVFAQEPVAPILKKSEMIIEIVVNRYKEGNINWDSTLGANSAPDVFGKIQLPGFPDCEVPVNEDSYILKQSCPVTEMPLETPVGFQLYDRDTLRIDDVIAIGTIKFQGNPTEASIGSIKVKLWYSDSAKVENKTTP